MNSNQYDQQQEQPYAHSEHPQSQQQTTITKKNEILPREPISGPDDTRLAELSEAYATILRIVGKTHHPGMDKTPLRAAKAIMELTSGYELNLNEIIDEAIFDSEIDLDPVSYQQNFIIIRDIQFNSLCEHHLLPFSGTVHIGYVPKNGRILGLSKFGRITDHFSKQLQVQESLTHSISTGLYHSKLTPCGVIVIIDAEHSCMSCRGVKKSGAVTTTISSAGLITTEQRQEFFSVVRCGLGGR